MLGLSDDCSQLQWLINQLELALADKPIEHLARDEWTTEVAIPVAADDVDFLWPPAPEFLLFQNESPQSCGVIPHCAVPHPDETIVA